MKQPDKQTIAIFMANFTGGGVQYCMLRLARALKKSGYTVLFVVMQEKGSLLQTARQEFDITILSASRQLAGAWKSILPLRRFLKERKPDVLIANMKRENLIALSACKICALPTRLFLVEHTLHSFDRNKLRRWMKNATERLVLPLFYPLADRIVAVCRSVAQDLENKLGTGKPRIDIVYNPVIPENLDRLVHTKAGHEWFNDPATEVILAIGRFSHEKGFPLLLEAFAAVRKQRPSARLIILGDGPERPALTDRIAQLGLKDSVALPGFQDNVFAWLSAARLFVLPSLWDEPFGLVLVEALACGTPVVSTNGGGPQEILDDGKYGILVPRNDAQALAQGLLQALEKPQDRDHLKQRGTFFSVEKSAEGYIALIEATTRD